MVRVNSLRSALYLIVLILFVQLTCFSDARVMDVDLSRAFLPLTGIGCGESCVWIPCVSAAIGCSCSNKICYRNGIIPEK
uniref:Cyclotide 1 n=1 Tax=Petunia hybrida TaxID=4102 RepID=I6S3T3_PETHY|nr:cyclotide precursor 1 [Petunia x hybrida]